MDFRGNGQINETTSDDIITLPSGISQLGLAYLFGAIAGP